MLPRTCLAAPARAAARGAWRSSRRLGGVGAAAAPAAAAGHQRAAGSTSQAAGRTRARLYYQGSGVPTSLRSTGQVGTHRDGLGSDGDFFGVDPVPTEVEVLNGRGRGFTVDEHGFALVEHPWRQLDYFDNGEVVQTYYPECEALVCSETGAKFAVAFDHNVRARDRKAAGQRIAGDGNAVQEPLITYGVHNDYTVTSAPSRIRQLAQPLKRNDTLRAARGSTPVIDPDSVEGLVSGRWLLVNVWRNIAEAPVARFPLGLCDASSTSPSELVVFEIRYPDRVGENYFARHSPGHRWFYFPEATRSEAVLLKCWDSRGRDFAELMPGGLTDLAGGAGAAPATFSLHSGFEDPATPEGAPDRESIEVRLAAFFQDP